MNLQVIGIERQRSKAKWPPTQVRRPREGVRLGALAVST